jgi:alpha-1,2-mannosyltransferase
LPGFRLDRPASGPGWLRSRQNWLLAAGIAVFVVALGCYLAFTFTHPAVRWLSPVDLNVYRSSGRVVLGHGIDFNPRAAAPLYAWPGHGLKFTYTPFAGLLFTGLTLLPWPVLTHLSIGVNIAALVAAVWVTLGGLRCRPALARLGGTLLIAGVLLWTEPVQRTLYLGQIELVLMALILWDLCQPDRRWWKGAGVGLAAGIKLVPLIFIPYLLLARRFREAAVAAGAFAATVLIGFLVLPGDSRTWWLRSLFIRGSRTGFAGWEGNQSLAGIITRLTGSIAAGKPSWLITAAVVLVVGVLAAALLDRAGHRVAGLVTCALTGLLVSPISWDHHWVWIVPAVTLLAVYGMRARSWLRWAWLAGAVVVAGLFGAWPGFLWHRPLDLGGFSMGFIWLPPNTNPGTYQKLGDQSWYAEYHWHGFELVTGNLYVLSGLAGLVLLVVVASGSARRARRTRRRSATQSATSPTTAARSTTGAPSTTA